MNSFSNEVRSYRALNTMADSGAIVLIGGAADKDIPVSEIAESCELNCKIYNRSASKLSVNEAERYYIDCVASLCPESVLLHIGGSDIEFFRSNQSAFDKAYLSLVERIKSDNSKVRIAVISIANPTKNEVVAEMNRHLKAIAESERCDYCDCEHTRAWEPAVTRQVFSFLYNEGFVEPLKIKRPLRDIVTLMYSYLKEINRNTVESFEPMSQVS